jgi:hypothetical protein
VGSHSCLHRLRLVLLQKGVPQTKAGSPCNQEPLQLNYLIFAILTKPGVASFSSWI